MSFNDTDDFDDNFEINLEDLAVLDHIEQDAIALEEVKSALPKKQQQQKIYQSFGYQNAPATIISHRQDAPKKQHQVADISILSCWIYPTNLAIREYQLSIVNKALFTNTLVALPTGLGKTMIAAVVMYNFYLWFPKGKIIFMAPTKPLVAQQIEACFKITGIPQCDTIELTGSTNAQSRKQIWTEKRVFFMTPQVMQNDLKTGTCPSDDITLLVVDEAHRASGNYSYCEVVAEMSARNEAFRVLALTATPGSDLKTVQEVIKNLKISHIEIRTEESLDIKAFTFDRKIDKIVIALSEPIVKIKTDFGKIIQGFLARLVKHKAFYSDDPNSVSNYTLLQARDRFRKSNSVPKGQASYIEGEFGVVISLSQSYALLTQHARQQLVTNHEFQRVFGYISEMIADPLFISHPKIDRLVSEVVEHFSNNELDDKAPGISDTRVMIFSQYRESVDEIVASLKMHEPLVRVMSFVGQSSGKRIGKGFTQKDQLKVISDYQAGNYNVLVATSIGEEGLDIGEVDLIICFDSQSSPIRMLQRVGRTGRKRDGRIVLLLSEGKEEEVQKVILEQQGKRLQMYPDSHCRLLPLGVKPLCIKRHIDIPERTELKRKGRIRRSGSSKCQESLILEKPDASMLQMQETYSTDPNSKYLSLSKYTTFNLSALPDIGKVSRSSQSRLLVDCLSFIEDLRNEPDNDFSARMSRGLILDDVYREKRSICRIAKANNRLSGYISDDQLSLFGGGGGASSVLDAGSECDEQDSNPLKKSSKRKGLSLSRKSVNQFRLDSDLSDIEVRSFKDIEKKSLTKTPESKDYSRNKGKLSLRNNYALISNSSDSDEDLLSVSFLPKSHSKLTNRSNAMSPKSMSPMISMGSKVPSATSSNHKSKTDSPFLDTRRKVLKQHMEHASPSAHKFDRAFNTDDFDISRSTTAIDTSINHPSLYIQNPILNATSALPEAQNDDYFSSELFPDLPENIDINDNDLKVLENVELDIPEDSNPIGLFNTDPMYEQADVGAHRTAIRLAEAVALSDKRFDTPADLYKSTRLASLFRAPKTIIYPVAIPRSLYYGTGPEDFFRIFNIPCELCVPDLPIAESEANIIESDYEFSEMDDMDDFINNFVEEELVPGVVAVTATPSRNFIDVSENGIQNAMVLDATPAVTNDKMRLDSGEDNSARYQTPAQITAGPLSAGGSSQHETPSQPIKFKKRKRLIVESPNCSIATATSAQNQNSSPLIVFSQSQKKEYKRIRQIARIIDSDESESKTAAPIPNNALQPEVLRERLTSKKKPRRAPLSRFELMQSNDAVGSRNTKIVKSRKFKRRIEEGNPFFDFEADVSMSDGEGGRIICNIEDSDEGSENLDLDLDGFIASQNTPDQSQMVGVYMQSVLSPGVDMDALKAYKNIKDGIDSDEEGSLVDFIVEDEDDSPPKSPKGSDDGFQNTKFKPKTQRPSVGFGKFKPTSFIPAHRGRLDLKSFEKESKNIVPDVERHPIPTSNDQPLEVTLAAFKTRDSSGLTRRPNLMQQNIRKSMIAAPSTSYEPNSPMSNTVAQRVQTGSMHSNGNTLQTNQSIRKPVYPMASIRSISHSHPSIGEGNAFFGARNAINHVTFIPPPPKTIVRMGRRLASNNIPATLEPPPHQGSRPWDIIQRRKHDESNRT